MCWVPALVSASVARKTSPATPPASHGRSPSWHWAVPVGHVLPPSGEEKRESLARSIPVSYTVPDASSLRSGSLKPVYDSPSSRRVQLLPLSSDVQIQTWF